MKRIQVVLLIAVFSLLQACASTFQAKPEAQSDFLEQNAKFGIPADAVVPHVHARSKVHWAAYDKIQVKPIVINDGFASQLSRDQEVEIRLLTKSFYDACGASLSRLCVGRGADAWCHDRPDSNYPGGTVMDWPAAPIEGQLATPSSE